MSRHAVLPALTFALLAGCATPDLRPFADETARLATAVSGEQRQIALKFDQVVALYDEACTKRSRAAPAQPPLSCRLKAERERQAADYAESRRVIDGVLEKSVAYAGALAELAAAGESGGDAAQSLLGSLKQLGGLVGVGGTAVSASVAAALEKIATAVTRVQAQRSLAAAAAAAQPAIVTVAEGIRELHAPSARLAASLHADELDANLTLAGEDLVGLFHDAAAGLDGLGRRLHALQLAAVASCGQDGDKAKCAQLPEALRNAESLGRVLDHLRPQYEAYQARRAAALRWRADRRDNLAAIARAAGAWQAEHANAAEALARCGGLMALRCMRVDAATLRAAVDQINEIRAERGR